MGKLAQAVLCGAKVVAIEGNFDQALEIVRLLSKQYPVAMVNSINPYRIEGQSTGGEQDVGKPPRGRADIQAHQVLRRDPEMFEPMRQLDPAPGHPGMVPALEGERDVGGDPLARFVEATGLGGDEAGHDQRLGAGPACGEATLDHQRIEARFFLLGHGGSIAEPPTAVPAPRKPAEETAKSGGRPPP